MPYSLAIFCGSYEDESTNARLARSIMGNLLADAWREIPLPPLDTLPPLRARQVHEPPEPVVGLREALAASDAALVVGPELAGGMAGSLKNALDWCISAPEGFYHRPVAIASVSASGGENALHQMARTLLWQGAHIVGAQGIVRGHFDERLIPVSYALADALHEALRYPHTQASSSRAIAASLGIHESPHFSAESV